MVVSFFCNSLDVPFAPLTVDAVVAVVSVGARCRDELIVPTGCIVAEFFMMLGSLLVPIVPLYVLPI